MPQMLQSFGFQALGQIESFRYYILFVLDMTYLRHMTDLISIHQNFPKIHIGNMLHLQYTIKLLAYVSSPQPTARRLCYQQSPHLRPVTVSRCQPKSQ